MHPDLVVTAYRHQERELEQALEHRRAALERPAGVSRSVSAVRRAWILEIRSAGHRVTTAVRRGRQAMADAAAPTECCSPA